MRREEAKLFRKVSLMTDQPFLNSAVIRSIRHSILSNLLLLNNAGAASIGSAVGAVLGFAYWAIAARMFEAQSVGSASAAISLMNFVGLLGEFSLGTLLIGETLKRGEKGRELASAALMTTIITSFVFAVIFTQIWNFVETAENNLTHNTLGFILFVYGVTITGLSIALDQCFIGILKSYLMMYRGIIFAFLKLILILGAAGLALDKTSQLNALFATWVVGQAVSILLIALYLKTRRRALWHKPDFGLLKSLSTAAMGHHLLNLVSQTPTLLLPFLVATVLSPTINAAFTAGWMVLNFALLIPAHLATILYTVGSTNRAELPERLRFSLGVCLPIAIGVGLVFLLYSKSILSIFNASYPEIVGNSLSLIGFSALGIVVKYHFIAAHRIDQKMIQASFFLGLGAILEIGFAVFGASLYNLDGFIAGWLAAIFIQSIAMLPKVLNMAELGFFQPKTPTTSSDQ